jgi:anti-sigma B factor antagonist
MAKTVSSLLVSVLDGTAFVKIVGRANFTLSVSFKTLVGELRARDYSSFVLDLGECVTMDSTFLGVLAGFAIKLADGSASAQAVCLQLLNPNQRVVDLLENLGIAHLFKLIQGTNSAPANFQPPPSQNDCTPSREEISRTCLEAHQVLMAVNPDNIPKFKDVAQFLAEDLKKAQS